MEKIVIDDNYKIESSEELSEKLTYKLLKEALKHYSTDRLEFKDKEAYKIFTVKIPGRKVNKKSKIIVSRFNDFSLEKYTEEISNKINTNTFLFADLSTHIDYNNLYEEASKPVRAGYNCINDNTSAYLKIYKEKKINYTSRFIAFSILNILLKIFSCSIGYISLPTYLIEYLIACAIWAKYDVEKKEMPTILAFIVLAIFGGFPLCADLLGVGISQSIGNLIGDIKNDSFSFSGFIDKHFKEPIRKLIRKIKTPKNFHGVEDELEQISESLDNDDIGHAPIKENEDAIIKINTSSLIKKIRKYIDYLPHKDRKKYLDKLNTLLENRREMSIDDFNDNVFYLNNEVINYLNLLNTNVDDELKELEIGKRLTR